MAKNRKALGVTIKEALEATVKSFKKGKGFWIADFSRNTQVDFKITKKGQEFDYFLPGDQDAEKQAKFPGARIFNFWINPKYRVGVFLLSNKKMTFNRKEIEKLLPEIKKFMQEENIHWSWLYLFAEEVDEEFKDFISHLFGYQIGIILGEVKTEKVYASDSFLGNSGKKLMKFR